MIGIELAAVAGFFLANNTFASRFGSQFINALPMSENSTFIKIWKGAIIAFQESPIIGIGPDVYRKMCPTLTQGFDLVDCHPHPHNYYIQLLAETGVIGLVAGCIMITSIILACFSYRKIDKDNIFHSNCICNSAGFLFSYSIIR